MVHLHRRQGVTTLWKGLGSCLVVRGMSLAAEDLFSKITPWPKWVSLIIFKINRTRSDVKIYFKFLGKWIIVQRSNNLVSIFCLNGKWQLLNNAMDQLILTRSIFVCFDHYSVSIAVVLPFYSASLVETVQSDIASEKPGIFDVFREGGDRLLSFHTPQKGRMIPIWGLVGPSVALGLSKYVFGWVNRTFVHQQKATSKNW